MRTHLLPKYANSKSRQVDFLSSLIENLNQFLPKKNLYALLTICTSFILFSTVAFAQTRVVTTPPITPATTWGGITFNLRTQNEIRVDTVFVSTSGTTGSTVPLELWYNTTAINGQPASGDFSGPSATWVQVIASQQVPTGVDLAPIVIPNGLVIPPNSYYGFYIGDPAFSNTGIRYASSSTIDSVSNGLVTIKTGANIGYGWVRNGTTYNSPRYFTGGVSYTIPTHGPNNASISSFIGPRNFCSGNQDVKVKLKNTGNNVLNTVTVQWTLDGVTQAPIYWYTPLDTFGGSAYPNDTIITLGNVFFNSARSIKAWTEYPNSMLDTVNNDDTISVTVAPALNGNYTINASGSGPNNFASFSAASAALSANGICGPVYITVSPGTYAEQAVFSQIPGVSSTNTITIDGVDTATRKLTFAGSSTSYPTLTISGVPYLTVKNLTINATVSTGFGVLINGTSDYSRISKCRINVVTGSSSTASAGIVVGGSSTSYSTGGRTDNLMLDSNAITGGYFGIVFYHSSSSPAENNNVLYNTVSNNYQYGIYSTYNKGILISGNFVNAGKFITSNYGIYCPNTSSSTLRVPEISNNRVINMGAYALYLTGSNAAGNKGRVINNMLGGGMRYGSNYLCYVSGSYWSFAHNTVHRDFTTATATYGGLYVASASGVSVMNNIFSSTKTGSNGLPFYAVNSTTLDSMNYNTFYRQDTSNGQLIYIGTALNSGSFKGFSGLNTNSKYEDPVFVSDTNLAVINACMLGTPLAYVTTDIYGATRSANPSKGALEYSRVNIDARLEAVVSPSGPTPSGLRDIVVRIKNSGSATLTSLLVNYTENNGTPKTVSWTGSLAPCDTASVVFNGGNQININSVHNMAFYTSLPNGVPDQNTANDTITAVFRPALSGNYTIGGAGASYPDFISAAADLNLKGVVGPVTFTVNPGTYTGQVELNVVPGAGAANPITFNGVDAATRIMTYTATSTSYPTLIITSVQNVTFRNLTITAASSSTGFGVLINGKSDGARITNCVINAPAGVNSTTTAGIVVGGTITSYSTGNKVDNITIDSNTTNGGYFGITCYSSSANYSVGNKVMYNTILNTYQYGIYMYYNRAITILNNLVNGGKYITSNYGIYCYGALNEGSVASMFKNNRVFNVGAYALYVQGSQASGNKGVIANNMLGGGMRYGSSYLCYLNGSNWSFTHNSVHRDFSTATTNYGGLYVVSASGVSVTNNILSSAKPGSLGLPLYCSNATTFDTLDYNTYYREDTSNSQLIYLGSAINISNFKGASGHNLNSRFAYPDFANDTTLATLNGCLTGLGLSYVATDIYGTARNATTPTVGATEYIKHTEDLKIEAVTYPNAPFIAGYQDIGVRVRNMGTSTITSFNLTYTNNNGFPVTTSWYGNLGTCDTVTVVFNGPYQLNINGFHNMKFYTSQPNFVADANPTNDTLETIFLLPLNGIYTVGGATADFATPADAIYALQLAGVSGPVTFNFTPNMPAFNAGFELGNITGISAANTITFNGNGDTLVGTNGTYIIALNGASYMTFNGFYMRAGDFANPGIGICMRGNTHHVTIKNNTIDIGMTSSSTATSAIAATASTTSPTTAGANATYLTIDSNTLIGGYYNLSLIGNSSYLDNYGHRLRGNVCRDFYAYGIYVTNGDSIRISGNEVHRMNRSSVTTFYGIYLSTSRNIKVISNKIHDPVNGTGTFTNYSVYVTTSVNSAGYETEFINNIIYNPATTSTIYAYYLLGTRDYMKFYHNTVDLDLNSSTGTVRGIFMSTAPNNHDFKNNIVSVRGTGTGTKHLIYASVASASITSDYNVLYMGATGGSNYVGYIGANQTTLADWQTASSVDANSRGFNPVFSNAAIGDLTPLSLNIDNMGTNVGVTSDITGAPRSTTTPDAGAFEFTGISGDMGLKNVMLKRASQCYSTNDTIFVVVENLIGNAVDFSIDPLTFVWNNAGPVNSNGTIIISSGTLATGAIDTFYATNVNMSMPGDYTLNAYIQSNAVNINTSNDTLLAPVLFNVMPILSVSPKTAFVNSPTDTVILQAVSPVFPGGAFLFTEVCHYRGATTGNPASWPSYLLADDYIEITGVPNSDLGGYTLEQWDASSMVSTYTFPTGTFMSPNGTAIIAVGQLGSSVPVPASFYYHGNGGFTGSFDSGITPTGRILKNSGGTIVDVVTYSGNSSYTFPAAANVSAADWSGNTPSSTSTCGLRLVGADLNNPTNWIVSSATNTQDPQTFNTNVPPPSPAALTGFNWNYNGSSISTTPRTVVGPYTTPGTYTYIASYTNACGTFYDTVIVTAGAGVPVKLLSFEANATGADVQVTWKTASEKNTARFEVFRSTDHKNWEPVETVKAAGNSNMTRSYRITDRNAMSLNAPVIYYKLKSVDRDGSFEWSHEASVNTTAQPGSISVYPNPFTDNLTVRVASESAAQIEITSLQGELLFNRSLTSDNGSISLGNLDLKAGIYFIRVTQNGTTSVQKLIKQ